MVTPNTLTPELSRKAQRKLQKKKKKFVNMFVGQNNGKDTCSNAGKNKAKIQMKNTALSMQGRNGPTQTGKISKKSSKGQVIVKKVVQGPTFQQNSSARYAALQAYINNELGRDEESESKSLKNSETSSNTKSRKLGKNTIRDKNKLKELENGIDQDDKEINFLQRQLQHNSRQKKSNNMFRNIFGSEIGDLFEALETEPTEADLLTEKPLEGLKLPNRARKEPKLELPKNTIFVETSKIGCEDPVPEVNLPSSNTASKKRLLNETEDACSEEPQQKKLRRSPLRQGKKILEKNQFASRCDGKESSTLAKEQLQTLQTNKGSAEALKSILNTKSKKFHKKNRSLNVSFDISKNEVRLIPPIIKESGFTVMDANTPLFCDMETESEINSDESDDSHANEIGLEDEVSLAKSYENGKFHDRILKPKLSFDSIGKSSLGKMTKKVQEVLVSNKLSLKKENPKHEQSADKRSKFTIPIDENLLSESDAESCSEDENSSETGSYSDIMSESDQEDAESDSSDSDKSGLNDSLSEDIYGRSRDSHGNVVELAASEDPLGYLTPAKRKLDQALQEQLSSDTMKRVRTQLRGRLNRLAEANLAGAVTMVCSLYETHPRHLLNVVLSELLLAELAGETLTLDRHCQECAVLLTALASNVAEEIGAHVVTDFVISWHEEMQRGTDASCPRLRNCLMFVCHLFSFGLLHSALLYDLLTRLTTHFSANAVEQMMVVVSSVGFLLRKDDPLALRDFIVAVQSKGASSDLPQLQLLHTMLRAVKNNNESKMPDYDPTYTEHLRKLLKSYVGGEVKVTPLRVTLDDLLHSETRGRWWIVGSAYTGPGALARPGLTGQTGPSKMSSSETKFSADFMKMAESMRISRPPKLNILYALTVGSESVAEAIEKLKELGLPPNQEKLIFDVMLFCIQKMRVYKAFYAILSIRLCVSEGKYKRLLQHALWDKFTDLDALKSKELKHLAKFIVHAVKEDALNLSVLKTLPFVDTNRKIVDFLEDIFCQLFTDEGGENVSLNAFEKLFLSKKLEPLRRQFSLFLQLFMLPKCEAGELDARCRARVLRVLDLLGSDGGVLF